MLYQRKQFSCPVRSGKTSNQNWDLAFLSKEEFKNKYNVSDEEYNNLTK